MLVMVRGLKVGVREGFILSERGGMKQDFYCLQPFIEIFGNCVNNRFQKMYQICRVRLNKWRAIDSTFFHGAAPSHKLAEFSELNWERAIGLEAGFAGSVPD
jgi:hypothetical protein